MTRGDVLVIAQPGVAAGFALAGFPVVEMGPAPDAGDRIARFAQEDRHALLLVDDALLRLVGDEDRAAMAKRAVPIVIPLPAPAFEANAAAPESYILMLLQRAIGYRVRLQ